MIEAVVAFIGKPNVGKSTIFNRIIGERKSIIEDTPGVTRDRLYAKASWLNKEFRVIDTGGIELKDAPFQELIRMQAQIAIEEADIIVYICDGKSGCDNDDMYIASLLKRSKKKVIVAVNKIDDGSKKNNIYDFYCLGLGDPIAVSGIHGVGIGDLLDEIVRNFPNKEYEDYEGSVRFSFIGRPNVGKSSLTNAILGEDRVIVSNIEGTTRDAIDTPFTRDGVEYVAIDTAGLKKKGKIFESIDKYAALRALSAIDRSDVCCIVIDGKDGIKEQDKHVAGYAHEAGKAVVIVVNKWDIVDKDTHTMSEFEKKIRNEFKFLSYAEIVFVSAMKNQRIDTLFKAITLSYESATKRISTSVLNDVLLEAVTRTPPLEFNGGILRILYANQVSSKPPMFVLFVNDPKYLHFSYQRFIENKLREAFGFEGTPIIIKCRSKKD